MVGQTEAVNSFNDCNSAAVARKLFISFNLSSDISIADGDAIADISHFFGSAFHIDYWLGCLCASPGATLRLMPRSAFAVNGACDMIAIETQYCANCSMWSHWSRNNRKIRLSAALGRGHFMVRAEQTTWSFQRPAGSRCRSQIHCCEVCHAVHVCEKCAIVKRHHSIVWAIHRIDFHSNMTFAPVDSTSTTTTEWNSLRKLFFWFYYSGHYRYRVVDFVFSNEAVDL